MSISKTIIIEKIKKLKDSIDYNMGDELERKTLIYNVTHNLPLETFHFDFDFSKCVTYLQKGGAEENDLIEQKQPEVQQPEVQQPEEPEVPDPINNLLGEMKPNDDVNNNNEQSNPIQNVMKSINKDDFKRSEVFDNLDIGEVDKKSIISDYIDLQFKGEKSSDGLFLISVDPFKLINSARKKAKEASLNYNFPGKYANEEAKQKDIELLKEIRKENKEIEKELKEGETINIIGEFIDIDKEFDNLNGDIQLLKDEVLNVKLNPEAVITRESNIEEILEESKKYKREQRNITPKGLINMTRILYKKKANLLQWLRIACLCEIIYKHMNEGEEDRKTFFSSKIKIDMNFILKLDELWKTDFIFRGARENEHFRKGLKFYE